MKACGVAVEREGQNQMALCPFHPDKTPSLSVHGQLYKCHGCGAKGDVLRFVMLKDNLNFPQALARLQAMVGQVPTAAEAPAPVPSPDRLVGGFTRPELLARVAKYYASHLSTSRQAREYMASRGLDHPELWDAFQVGYADGSLRTALPLSGPEVEALTQLGILNERGKEHFYGCVVVPLSHPDIGIVGMYGRRILPNSKVTHLYLRGTKRGVLNWQALHASSSVVLAECVLDALSIWTAGVRDVTCLFGAGALPVDLQELLPRYGTEEVRFCLDADPAGQKGTATLARTFLQQGIRCQTITLPDGQDANDVLLDAGPEALRHALEQATPVVATTEDGDGVSAIMPQVETVDLGFIVHFGAVVYRVTPRAPFTGRLSALVRGTHGELTSAEQVNFYSDRNRTQWVRNAARNLKLATGDTEAHMTFLLAEAERWVEYTVLRSQQEAQSRPEPMTDKEKSAVLGFLRLANLVEVILSDMEALGYVGEEKCKLLAYLIGLSRRMERPMSGIILSQSGAGKSTLTELVESLTPPEEVELFSRLSPMALGYLAKDYLKRKLLILEERVGAEGADYFIRTLQTKNFLRHAVPMKDPLTGQMHTRVIEVEGPIAYLETTTQTRVNFENATRCFELTLDESEEQTARIHERQRLMRDFDTVLQNAGAREPVEAIRRRHHQAQRLLEPARILNRFKPYLRFPKRWLRTRRDHERFLSLVDVITFLHQYSRESGTFLEGDTPVRYVVSTVGDYRLAYELAKDVLDKTLHELSRHALELKEAIGGLLDRMGNPRQRYELTFTRRELRDFVQWEDHRLRDTLQELVLMEHLAIEGGSQGKTFRYRLLEEPNGEPLPLSGLTTPEELEERLATAGRL
jgi:DNA primase catalytic core